MFMKLYVHHIYIVLTLQGFHAIGTSKPCIKVVLKMGVANTKK